MKLTEEEKQRRKEALRQKRYDEVHKVIDGIDYKFCKDCEKWLPCNREYYYTNKSNGIDGYNPYCINCTKKRAVKYQEENPEKMKEIYRRRDAIKTPIKTERARKAAKVQRLRGDHKKWRAENRDKVREYSKKRSQHKKHEISKEEWGNCKSYFDNCCAYCGLHSSQHFRNWGEVPKKIDFHKEHVDHEGTNDLSNCVPSCQSCNSQKWTYSLEEWFNENNPKFNQDRLEKIKSWLEEDYKQYIKKRD